MAFQVHTGKSINVGPITLYSHFDAANPANNVIDTTATLQATCASGACRVGVLPGGDGRTIYVDGLTATSGGGANVALTSPQYPGLTGGFLVQVAQANNAPPAIDAVTGVTASAEYDSPATRP